MTAWALFCHDFDLSKGINILSEKCPVVLDHYTFQGYNMKHLFLILIFLPILCFAEVPSHQGHHITVEKSGNIKIGGYKSTDEMLKARHYVADNKDFSKWFNRNMSNSTVKTYTGAASRSTVPTVLEHEVSKKAVMRNLFGKVSKFAKTPFVGRLGWWGLAASFVIPYLIDEFYLDEDLAAFVSIEKYYFVVVTSDYNTANLGTFNSLAKMHENCNNRRLPCAVVKQIPSTYTGDGRVDFCKTYGENRPDGSYLTFDSINGNRCYNKGKNTVSSTFVSTARINEPREMTYDDFERLVLPAAEADPSPFVNYSRDSQDSPPASFAYVGVTATAGSSVDTDTYTDPIDGKAKQTKITINPDGKTATLQDTLRPDLQGDTEVAPTPKPLPDNDSDTGTETKPDTKPDSEASAPLQCDSDKYPNSLGCVDTSEEIKDASMVIPQETVPLDFQVKNYITSSTGTCPQGSQFTLNFFGSNSYEFSFEPVCKFAEMIKYALWVCSWLLAYFIIIGRSE